MGLLDQITDAISGGAQQVQDTLGNASGALGSLLENTGGLSGLVDKFNQAGLGETVQSWISQGENLPVSLEQIQSVLGPDTLNALAERVGIDPAQAASWLSDNLPEWVNQLTPDGQLPDVGGLLDQGVAAVKGLFDRF